MMTADSHDDRDNGLTDLLAQVTSAFGLDDLNGHLHAGGTAGMRIAAENSAGTRYMIRVRPREACRDASMEFEHAALRAYRRAGLPVPSPRETTAGDAWLDTQRGRVEVFEWLAGEPFRERSRKQIESLAKFLARFHAAGTSIDHRGKDGVRREDHPDELTPYLERLRELSPNDKQKRWLELLTQELARLRRELPDDRCAALPQAIIHGDLHPGNVAFRGNRVCAVYDFDYLSRQARVRDLTDGIILFCSRRAAPLDTGSIRSLTQMFEPDFKESRAWLSAYAAAAAEEMSPALTDDEWKAMPLFIRSRWLQMRLRGGRKIAEGERLTYVLRGIELPLVWLDRRASTFLSEIRESIEGL